LSRYFGVAKPFGLNSTMVQESEYWLHTFLFATFIGFTYIKQGHVRIDLVRDKLPIKAKYAIEIFGCLAFLIPYAVIATMYCYQYAHASFLKVRRPSRLSGCPISGC
jgi:TRAP-type mannitol/chloroaromatic compound transport system permease small subunit